VTRDISVPDTERRILRGHRARTVPRVPAWIALLIGLGLIAGGAALVLVGVGVLRPRPRVLVPDAVPYAIGVVFVVVGTWLLAIKIGDVLRDARARRFRRTMPSSPWLADHPWNPAGAWDETGRQATAGAAVTVILALFLVPFNWVAFSARSGIPLSGRIVFVLVTGAFDILTAFVAGYSAYLGWRRVRFGPIFLGFERLPCTLGTSTRVWLRVPRPPADCRLAATLRCVEERYVTDGDSSSTLSDQVWADTPSIEPAWGRSGGSWNLPIELRLPLGPYETRLADRPPRYWELEVHGEAPGVDFDATFLLPVYAQGPSG